MADPTYIAIPTDVGLIKIQKAMFTGEDLELTVMAYGDGNGEYYLPTHSQTELRNELGTTIIQAKTLDTDTTVTWFYAIIGAHLPSGVIREIGLYDSEGDLCFVANTPEVHKVETSEGTMVDIPIELGIKNSYAEYITIPVQPSGEYASQIWVNEHYANKQLSNLELVNYNGPVLWEDYNSQDLDDARTVILRDLSTGQILSPYGTGGISKLITIDYINIDLPTPVDPDDQLYIDNIRALNEETGEIETVHGTEEI